MWFLFASSLFFSSASSYAWLRWFLPGDFSRSANGFSSYFFHVIFPRIFLRGIFLLLSPNLSFLWYHGTLYFYFSYPAEFRVFDFTQPLLPIFGSLTLKVSQNSIRSSNMTRRNNATSIAADKGRLIRINPSNHPHWTLGWMAFYCLQVSPYHRWFQECWVLVGSGWLALCSLEFLVLGRQIETGIKFYRKMGVIFPSRNIWIRGQTTQTRWYLPNNK